MRLRASFRQNLKPIYRKYPRFKRVLAQTRDVVGQVWHSAATMFPELVIKPDPRRLYISLTADCNSRCKGCLYGREFMHGHQLPLPIVKTLLDDAKAAGVESVRLYGGEPLLHRDIPQIVAHSVQLGLDTWLTTNAFLLKKKIDSLVDAGLTKLSIGFYGIGEGYNTYVQRPDMFRRIEEGIAYVRDRYGMKLSIKMDWLLMRPTCDLETVRATLAFAERYHMPIHVNLVHYSLPYFTEGEERELQFTPEDRPAIESVVEELLRFRSIRPDLMHNTEVGLRSIPDWLMKGPAMRVPCTEYELLWVGPDGTVQMCYVTFKLGNLHEKRLSEMLFTSDHRRAACDAFKLNCSNCHCSYDKRVNLHMPTRRLYQ